MAEIRIGDDFSDVPAGRFRNDGPFSGEEFREALLWPKLSALLEGELLTVHLDGTEGYGSSFLEESFGGLVRVHAASPVDLKQKLRLKSEDASLVEEIWSYIEQGHIK